MPDKIKEAFEATKDNGIFLDEEDFRGSLSKEPKAVFELFKSDKKYVDLFLDYDDFENSLGLKKKEQAIPFDGQQFGGKSEEPLLPLTSSTVSPSVSKQPKSTIPLESTGEKQISKVNTLSDFNKKYNTKYTPAQMQGKQPVELQPEDEGIATELFQSAQRGSAMLGSMLANTPSFIYNIAAYPQNKIAELTGLPIGTSPAQIAETLGLPENELANYYEQVVKDGQAKVQQKYDKGVTEYLFGDNPDYKKGFRLLANQVVESAPISLSMMMGNAAGIGAVGSTLGGGVVFGAGNMQELEGADMSETAKVENALSKGLFEGIFEQFGVTKLGGVVTDIFKKQGAEAAANIAKEGFKDVYLPALKKYVGIGAEESIGEAATQFSQNMVTILSGENPNLNPMEGVADAALVGLGSSVAYSTPTSVAEVLALSKKRKEIKENQSKLQKIEQAVSNPETSQDAKAVLSNMANDINGSIADAYDESKSLYQNLSEEDKNELSQILTKKQELEIASEDPNIDDEIKKDILVQVEGLDNRVGELADKSNEVQAGGEVPQEAGKTENEIKVEELRAQERAELAEAIPNIEEYKVDGKVDESLITDAADLKTYRDIYERYNDEITPLLEGAKEKQVALLPVEAEAKEQTPEVKEQKEENKASEPSKSGKNYQDAQNINSIVSKENPDVSVLIQPKGDNLVLTAIYVGKGKRRGGIGSKALETIKREAKKLGKKVVLDATNELDQETDLERLGNFYERNGFKKVGENKYEYDPKAEVSSGDTGSRTDNTGAEVGDIASVTDKGESGKEAVSEAEVVKNPILKRLNKGFLKIGTTIFDNAKQLMDKAKELTEKGEQVQFSMTMPDGSVKDVKRVQAAVVDGFYSNTENALAQVKQEKMSGNQWATQLLSRGANKEEMAWTGLEGFLKENAAKSIFKADIQQYLKDNRIEVVEVVKGGVLSFKEKAKKEGYDIVKNDEESDYSGEDIFDVVNIKNGLTSATGDLTYIEQWINTEIPDEDNTKFSQYQLEGEKENYKEVLVLLPNKEEDVINDYNNARDNLENFENSISGTPTKEERLKYSELSEKVQELESKLPKDVNIQQGRAYTNKIPFRNPSHFDEPNILVHLRMNTRTDSKGNKVLFLEEVQSDWGQEGKRRGFADASKQESIINQAKEKINAYAESNEKLGLLPMSSSSEVENFKRGNTEATAQIDKEIARIERYKDTVRNNRDWDAANKEIEKLENEKIEIKKQILANFKGIEEQNRIIYLAEREITKSSVLTSTAPFVTDTNAWTKLGLKVALKEAIKQGVDKIAWTTGEQQNERYDLRKQVDNINYLSNGDGTYQVYAKKDGNIIFKEKALPESQLESSFGKDVAEKIINDKGQATEDLATKVLEGDDLMVGGKGMKGFYGSPTEGSLGIVGNVAKSLFKQEPKTVNLETVKNNEYTLGEANYVGGIGVYDGKGDMVAEFDTKAEANKFIASKSSSTQYSINITPELKESVEEGLPLFHYGAKGEILGFTFNGKIYLNGEKITAQTTMEEAGHIWVNWSKENAVDLYKAGLSKVKGSKYLAEVEANKSYQKEALKLGKKGSPAYNNYMKEEALAKAIADNGAKFVTETRKNDFIQWVNEMWKQVAKAFGIQDLSTKQIKALTLEEFAKMAASDVFAKEKQKFPENVLNIAKETGLSPQEVERTYKKYDGTKSIEEITIEDYNSARAAGNEQKLENSKKAFEALLSEESDSPTAKKKAAKIKEEVSKETFTEASEIMNNIDSIRQQLLKAGVIKSIKCKWGK
jgi:hypothetical protein